MAGDELEFVEWLRGEVRHQRTGGPAASGTQAPSGTRMEGQSNGSHTLVELGIGDDMAIVQPLWHPDVHRGAPRVLISSDMLLDGVHFDANRHPLAQIGRKAIACSLSDCAAMAVQPMAATVSLALPAGRALADAQEIFRGMFGMAAEYDLAIVGGDTTRWDHPVAIDVAITATPYDGIEPVTRSGARAGDTLFVTGKLGGSLLGRHLNFAPRVREARMLAEQLGDRLHAMIDISDGLALDLWRLCRASNVGATLDQDQLEAVTSDDARRAAAADGKTPLDHVLSDGEDFELLLSVAGEVTEQCRIANSECRINPVGEVTTGELLLRRPDGRVDPLEPEGYVH